MMFIWIYNQEEHQKISADYPEKKRFQNRGEHDKYIQKDHHPAIVSREIFEVVQNMREIRSNIERHADGTVTRKAKRYTGKKVNKRGIQQLGIL